MGFRGGGQIDPPLRILVFKYLSRDRVNKRSRSMLDLDIHDLRVQRQDHFFKREFYSCKTENVLVNSDISDICGKSLKRQQKFHSFPVLL